MLPECYVSLFRNGHNQALCWIAPCSRETVGSFPVRPD